MGRQARRAHRGSHGPRHGGDGAEIALRHFRRAVERFDRGDAAGAAKDLDVVLRVMPDSPDAHCLRGAVANQLGDHETAARHLEVGVRGLGRVTRDTRDAHNELALALRAVGLLEDSERVLATLLDAQPDYATGWHNLGLALDALDRHDEAIAAARRATVLAPSEPGHLLLLGKLLRRQGRLLSAAASLRRAHELVPEEPTINTVLGNTLFYLGEVDASIACFRRAAAIVPDVAAMHTNLATMLSAAGRYDEALAAHARALELAPDDPDVVVRHAATLLNLGRLEEGWRAYDGRLGTQPKARRWTGTPQWDGSSLAGRTLLVYREQGIGDELMFASCYPDLIAAADRVVIECDERVETLVARSFPDAVVFGQSSAGDRPDVDDAPQPVHPTADVAVPSGSVAQHLRASIDAFPRRERFLVADPATAAEFATRLAACGPPPYVGVSWRSMIRTAERRLEYTRLDEWGPILRTRGVTFVLLQYDQCEREVADAEARFGVRIHRWRDVDLMNDFDRVAALMTNLDLVLAPRNAVTMLAGALGAPAVALGNVGDWSECGTGQLPWFTSVECLNRSVTDDWGPVLGETAERVRALAAGRPALRTMSERKATVSR
jgi:Flp pilus assembly protein TadD